MSETPFDRTRLFALTEAYCLEELGDAELAELNQLLRSSPEACAIFGNYVQLHANLEERLLSEVDVAQLASPASETVASKSPLEAMVRFFSTPTPFSMTAAAIVVGLLVTAMAFMAPPFYRAIAGRSPEERPAKPQFVAQITAIRNTVWPNENTALSPGLFLLPGRSIELRAGLIEVSFHSGARIVLEGPAKLAVDDAMLCSLKLGKCVALVPKQARGFTVRVDENRIVDLGTEFAVEKTPAGDTEVHVITGRVEVFSGPPGTNENGAEVTTGQAVRLKKAGGNTIVENIGYDAKRFVRQTPAPMKRSLTLANPSFEDMSLPDGKISGATPAKWTSNNAGDGTFNPNGEEAPYHNPLLADNSPTRGRLGTMSGPTFGFMYSDNRSGEFSQTLDEKLSPETTYVLTVAVGRRDRNYATKRNQEASTVTLNLLAGGQVIATASGHPDNLAEPSNFVDLVARARIGKNHPQLGQPLSIEIVKGNDGDYCDIDNARLTAWQHE